MFEKREFEKVGGRKTVVVLCIDTSNSVYPYQKEINSAVKAFLEELERAPEARFGTEVAIVTYNTAPHLHCDFTANKSYIKNNPIVIPHINESGGWTDIGPALDYAIDLAKKRVQQIRCEGTHVYAPWIFLFTDGKPENKGKDADAKMERSIKNLQSYEPPQRSNDKIYYVGVGVGENVNVPLMKRISAHGSARYIHTGSFSNLSKIFRFFGATTVTNGENQQRVQQEADNIANPVMSIPPDSVSFVSERPESNNVIFEEWLESDTSENLDMSFINQRLDIFPPAPPPEPKRITINGTVIADVETPVSMQTADANAVFENAKRNTLI